MRSPRLAPPRPVLAGLATLALAALACACSKPPPVEAGKQVSMLYEARTIEGELVDANPEAGPITFVVGAGKMRPAVEAKLLGMRVGEEKTFAIENAYGEYDDGKTGTLTRAAVAGEAKVGDHVDMVGGVPAKIKELHESHIVLDLNHPLAGKEIVFTVKIVAVTEPEPESEPDSEAEGS